MPRPRTVEDSAVLDAAGEVAMRVGPGQLTLGLVGAEIGLSPATLLQRFGSKRRLLLAMAERWADRADAPLVAARPEHDSPLESLLAGLTALAAGVNSPERLATSLGYLQLDMTDPDFRRLALAGQRRVRGRIEELVREAVEAGELAGCEPAELAAALHNAFNGSLVTWGLCREGALEDWVRRQLGLLLEPYAPGRT